MMPPLLHFCLAAGQLFLHVDSHPLPPPKFSPDACPPGMVAIAAGVWVAEGRIDRQAKSLVLVAGPWQTAGEQCETCPRTLPTTCVADYQGMEIIPGGSGVTKLHVFGQIHWLPALRRFGR